MKSAQTLLFLLATLVAFAQPIPQTKKVTAKFFPEFDVVINTPAFQKKKGFTTYKELMAFIDQKVTAHPNLLSYQFIGESQKGKQIPMLTLTNSAKSGKKIRVWMQGGLHGDEPASTEGLLHLIDRLLEDEELRKQLDNVVLTIVPMANIDGYQKQHRHAANGLDLNRDQTKLMAPESVYLKQAFTNFQAHVALDFHEYRPYRRDYAQLSDWGVTGYYDVMFLYSGNLNVPEKLRQFTQTQFVNPAKAVVGQSGLSHSDYFTSDDVHGEMIFTRGSISARSSATNNALTNCVSTLIEVRGVGLGRTSFARRVTTTYLVALSYLQSATTNAQQVYQTLSEVSETPNTTIVVTSKRPIISDSINFVDISTNERIKLACLVRDAWFATPNLQRTRPFAYIILPGHEDVMNKLKTLGLEVEILAKAKEISVEGYEITSYKRSTYPYEGVYVQDVECRTIPITSTFPAGSYVVRTNQKNGNLLAEVLEPEASSSLVSFSVIKTQMGQELPVYRILTEQNP
jgi:hypothetical protein